MSVPITIPKAKKKATTNKLVVVKKKGINPQKLKKKISKNNTKITGAYMKLLIDKLFSKRSKTMCNKTTKKLNKLEKLLLPNKLNLINK